MRRGLTYGTDRLTIRIWPTHAGRCDEEEQDALRGTHRAGAAPGEDDYGAKLVKYVPAEVLAAFIALSGVPDTAAQRWFVLAVTAVCEFVYLGFSTRITKLWTPFLSVIALFAWIAGTTDFGHDLFKMSATWQHLTLLSAVFLIPALDMMFDHLCDSST